MLMAILITLADPGLVYPDFVRPQDSGEQGMWHVAWGGNLSADQTLITFKPD